jgi:hypothetical protein
MLVDLESLSQEYVGCPHCYYGYDNYDQKINGSGPPTPGMPINNSKLIPRFERCKLVRVVKGSLPAGTINCISLRGLERSNTEIFISNGGCRLYQITGIRTMVLAPNCELEVSNFDGDIIAHYVDFIVSPGRYRISVKNIGIPYFKYIVCKYRYGFLDEELQQMWNYIYPGKRPKHKYLIHYKPPVGIYCKYPMYLDKNEIYEKCSYNELIVDEFNFCYLWFVTSERVVGPHQ